jgi:hypothetical protein
VSTFGPDQMLVFGGTPDYTVPMKGFTYEGAPPNGDGQAALHVSGRIVLGDTLVVGANPVSGGFIEPIVR